MSEENELLKTLTSLLSENTEDEKPEKNDDTDENPFDLGMILKLGNMFSELNTDDDRARLLRDLKPFLSSEKSEKIDQAIKMLKLIKIAQKAKSENLF